MMHHIYSNAFNSFTTSADPTHCLLSVYAITLFLINGISSNAISLPYSIEALLPIQPIVKSFKLEQSAAKQYAYVTESKSNPFISRYFNLSQVENIATISLAPDKSELLKSAFTRLEQHANILFAVSTLLRSISHMHCNK